MSMCRQIDGTTDKVDEHFLGAKGRSSMSSDTPGSITGANAWTFERTGKPISPYVQEHIDLIASMRAGKPLNELKQVAESTLTAIMGREAAYTGHEIKWDDILNADMELTPPQIRLCRAAGAAGPDAGRDQAGAEVERVRASGS